MKVIEIKQQINVELSLGYSEIKLVAKFEDTFPHGGIYCLESHHLIRLKTVNPNQVLNKVEEIRNTHPYFKLSRCESPIELKFYVFLFREIPGLEPQFEIGPYRVDFVVPDKKIIFEIDGHLFHSSREDRTNDARRQRYLQKHGWKVVRFTGTEIHRDILTV